MTLTFPTVDGYDFNDSEQALYEYLLRLEFLEDKLRGEFDDAMDAWRSSEELEVRLQREFDAMVRLGIENMHVVPRDGIATIGPTLIYTPAAARGEIQSEALDLQAEVAAGSLILMADDLVQRLRHSIIDTATGEPPAPKDFKLHALLDGSCHAAPLIWAAGNAYRHAKDWEGLIDGSGEAVPAHPEFKRSKPTREVLEASVGLEPAREGSVCLAALSVLSWREKQPDFETLWGTLVGIGEDFARVQGRPGSYEKVAEALEYQRSYAGLDISSTGESGEDGRDLHTAES